MINSLHHQTNGDVRGFVGIYTKIELFGEFVLFEGERIEETNNDIFLVKPIEELHELELLVGSAHDPCVSTNDCQEESDFLYI